MSRPRTLWSQAEAPDPRMMAYTVGSDREADARLLRWDVLGSLGHVEALARGGVVDERMRARMRRALLRALRAVDAGALTIDARHEDVHSAVEFWLTEHAGRVGEQVHVGRSRNDQIAVDLRLALKDEVLSIHRLITEFAGVLLQFAAKYRSVVWPGYTHQRSAMPSSGGLWAAGYAANLLDAADMVQGFWPMLDRCPLGSAAGFGVPLPLEREAAARALGFSGVDLPVTATQGGRGVIEASVLFWCSVAMRTLAKLSADVILFSAPEFGWLRLPDRWSTGSSIMPQKRNPDLFELTRGRAALVDADLAAILALTAKLGGGYHRDFQLLKVPLWHGVDQTREALAVLAAAAPDLIVDATRARAALDPGIFATDEVVRRVGEGMTFREAYRSVSSDVTDGVAIPSIATSQLLRSRQSSGAMGRLALGALESRRRGGQRWQRRTERRFAAAIRALTGRRT